MADIDRNHQVTAFDTDLGQAHPTAAGTTNFGTANALDQLSGGLPTGYDTNGNSFGDGVRAYGYDAEGAGRMLLASLPNNGRAIYRYDPFGRRYSKTVNGVTTIYVHDLAGNDIAEYDGATGAVLRYNRFSPNTAAPIATLGPDGRTLQAYLNIDRLGSVVSLTDAAGQRQNVVAYLPFGQSTTGAPPAGSGYGYAGLSLRRRDRALLRPQPLLRPAFWTLPPARSHRTGRRRKPLHIRRKRSN